ncbi:hypothetical protein BDY17DRAFT_21620 [Neohortaea acidophila]|uniref:F-box domain-containing protein n=1 Tax=Neohortaea acidophila TaxID=245834 RepID=A0A6A6Q6M6_9PEZI|nr:uncharacterized protein BDY17DRAFT_21620 [Neohortaea acidophila]KAF2487955.1 hypothetical protein BDY17DRAFT_21620 [Neohortaea acidophila]
MVFYARPKRRQPATEHAKAATFTTLPDEVLLSVVENLEITSVLHLRLTCHSLVPVCATVMRQLLNRLYLHPSPKALANVAHICEHPVFSKYIEEVVVLGQPLWREIEASCPDYRRSPNGLVSQSIARSGRPTPGYHSECTWEERFYVWPAMVAKDADKSRVRACEEREPDCRLRPVLEYLVGALRKLPQLSRLAFEEEASGSGFNQLCAVYISRFAKRLTQAPPKQLPEGTNKGTVVAKPRARVSDAHVFYGLLLDPRLSFSSVHQGRELPFADVGRIQYHQRIPGSPSPDPFETITSLDLSIDCGWRRNASHLLYHHLIRQTRVKLRRVKLTLTPDAPWRRPAPEDLLATILHSLQFPHLEGLEIELRECGPLEYCDATPPMYMDRRPRPSCLEFDMPGFLRRHCDTLTCLSFKNVIFVCSNSFDPYSVSHSIRDCLEILDEAPKLESIEWTVNYYTHDPRCKHPADFPLQCRKFHCGVYCVTGWGDPRLEHIETAALTHGVPLAYDRGLWDFGEGIMRRRKFEKRNVETDDELSAVVRKLKDSRVAVAEES